MFRTKQPESANLYFTENETNIQKILSSNQNTLSLFDSERFYQLYSFPAFRLIAKSPPNVNIAFTSNNSKSKL